MLEIVYRQNEFAILMFGKIGFPQVVRVEKADRDRDANLLDLIFGDLRLDEGRLSVIGEECGRKVDRPVHDRPEFFGRLLLEESFFVADEQTRI